MTSVNCMFCLGTSGSGMSKEHLLSVPVAAAFGLEREGFVGRLGTEDLQPRLDRLEQMQVRLPCQTCNNTWMNELEHRMAVVADWVKEGVSPLGPDGVLTMLRWLLKTYIVFTVLEAGVRKFGRDGQDDFYVLPEVTRAHQLKAGDPDAFAGVAVGLIRSPERRFAWSFGNPTVTPTEPHNPNCRSAGALIITVGLLQAWIAVPFFRSANVKMRSRVLPLDADLRFLQLNRSKRLTQKVAEITVDNGPIDVPALFEAVRYEALRGVDHT